MRACSSLDAIIAFEAQFPSSFMNNVTKQIRVLVVDDSAFMRKAISNMLVESPEFQVIDTARNGEDALRKVAALQPDVMTLDIDMPGMGGLEVLEQVMKTHPLPVVMLSSLSRAGAEITIRALELGAVDFVFKAMAGYSLKLSEIRESLHSKVRIAAKAVGKIRIQGTTNVKRKLQTPSYLEGTRDNRIQKEPASAYYPSSQTSALTRKDTTLSEHVPHLLTIGCSTGGPQALQEILVDLPGTLPAAVVVAQHMPKFFTKPFSDRLNAACGLKVREAHHGDWVQVGLVLIAPGGQHLTLQETSAGVRVQISDEPKHLLYRPSVDLMMASAAAIFGDKVLSVVLTGMGQDGLEGARAVRDRGGKVIAQDEESSIVYGMPKAVAEQGCADRIVSLSSMAQEMQRQLHVMISRSTARMGNCLTGAPAG